MDGARGALRSVLIKLIAINDELMSLDIGQPRVGGDETEARN